MRLGLRFLVGVVCLLLAVGTIGSADAATRLDAQGYATAVDGDYAIVGAQWHDGYRGAAYIYKRSGDGWSEGQKLSPPDLGRFDHFGSSVAISGDYAVVGATWQNLLSGTVYVFKRVGSEWVQHQKLTAGDGRPDMRFGYNVRIEGSEITIGARSMDLAYRFRQSGNDWVEETKVALPALEKADAQSGEDLIESVTESDLLILTEMLRASTEAPPLPALTQDLPSPEVVIATDGAFEDRVEIMWSSVDLNAIVYRIERNDTLISAASSKDSLYVDYTGDRGVTYNYCVIVSDMMEDQSAPACDSGSSVVFPPESFSASWGNFDQFVRLTWTDMSSVEMGYLVKRGVDVIDTTAADVEVYEDSTAVVDVWYTYHIIAMDSNGVQSTPVEDEGYRAIILPPLDLSASKGEYQDFVRLTWTDQAENELAYLIFRDEEPLDSIGPFPGTGTVVYHDSTAVFGYCHGYCVGTQDSSGACDWFNACDGGGRGILPAPEDVMATDTTYDDRVEISWIDVSDLEDGFEIQRDGTPIDTVEANSTLCTDFAATPGAVHEYCVVAISDLGGRSAPICDSGLHALVVAPSEVQATDGEYEDRVDITWNSTATKAAFFNIYRDETFIESVGVNTRFCSDYGGTAGQEYEYTVSAVTGLLAESPALPDTGSRALRPPTAVAASDNEFEEKIVITWADNSRLEQGYILYREFWHEPVDTVFYLGANRTSYTDWTAGPGILYTYRIAAFDSLSGTVGYSEAAADSGQRTLTPPSNVRAGDGEFETKVEITWVDNSGAEEGYRIYRNSELIGSTDDNFTSYVDTSPVFAQTSKYSVAAFDSYGESWTVSDSGSTTILAPGSFNASDVYEDRIELTWVDLSEVEDKYIISRNGVAFDSVGADTTFFTDATAAPGMTYEYCVRAVKNGYSSVEVCDDGRCFSPTTLVTEMDLKLLASDGAVGDEFGHSVAISGDVAIIGAPRNRDNGSESGSAYIFGRAADGTWSQAQKLLASDGAEYDHFGYSVAVDGDVAIVGAYGGNYDKGLVYIFERNGDGSWPSTETSKLLASDGNVNTLFGVSVAISNGVAIVGAPWASAKRGSAYIFKRGGGGSWPSTETAKLLASDGIAEDFLGSSVAISGDVAIVGAQGYDSLRGSAYIFDAGSGGSWPSTETAKLQASDGVADDRFGFSVAISGGVAIVGAYRDDSDRGSAYSFERGVNGTWTQTQKLLASDGTVGNIFGSSVAMEGGVALIGAHVGYLARGSAYSFERIAGGTWTQTQKFMASDWGSYDHFGVSVAIDDGMILIGAKEHSSNTGKAYVWPPGTVVASDGNLTSRVRVEWRHHSSNEDGFHIYRDGELIATLAPDVAMYEDFEAQPGRTYEYGVAGFTLAAGDGQRFGDFGWRPPNGNITGRISTPTGAGVKGISVDLDPQPIRSLLLDGKEGHVCIPDRDRTFDFTADSNYTIEAWIRYSGAGGSGAGNGVIMAKATSYPFPFLLSNLLADGQPGRLRFLVRDRGGYVLVTSSRNNLNDDTWHHVACVHDAAQDKLRIYIDGTLEGNTPYASLGDIRNTADVTLGTGLKFFGGGSFGGQIDEVRIWSVARDSSDIQATMNRQLEGDEDGLLGYWPLDEGESPVITDLTVGAHYGSMQKGVYWADNAAPIDISAKTDLEGNYTLDKIRYGQETTFDVQPYEGERQFSPAFKAITLSTEQPVENQVNFIETSSFTVSGAVDFAGTDCFAPNVEIHVDGQLGTLTDKNGKFAVAVSHGDHWIKPRLEGRTFDPDSVQLTVEGDLPGVTFSDTTTRLLSGLVGGGCRTPIGNVMIRVRNESDCLDTTYTIETGIFTDYEITLPPQQYLVSADVITGSIPEGLNVIDITKFFDNLGERVVDLTNADSTLDFIYRAPLEVTIEGLDDYITCASLTFHGQNLPDSLPVIPQGTHLSLTINVNEDYGSGNICPLDSGTVTIFDEIFDLQDTPIVLEVKNGVANYNSFACTPSLIAGRVDPAGNDRSFQKALRAMVTVEGRRPVTATEWVLVTGHVAPEGVDFVTASSTEFLSYILRDPPGDNSYAFLEAGESMRTRIDYESFSITDQIGVSFTARFGLQLTTWFGIGAGTATEITAKSGFSTETLAGHMTNRESGTDVTVTTTETFSTSTNELLAGEGGDVFVGTGFNFIFAEVGVVEVENCEVVRSTSVGFEPDSTATTFAYTHQFINDVLIPEFNSKAAYYNGLGYPDSASMFSARERNWTNILAYNDSLKQEAEFKINRSFSAGAEFSYSIETDTTKFFNEVHGFVGDFSGDFGQFSFGSVSTDFGLSIPVRISTQYIPDMTDEEASRSLTVGYVFSDGDLGDHFTVDIKEDALFPSPVFDVLAGASSCPYEPWPNLDGEARMVPRDKAVLSVGGDLVLNGVPLDKPATFTLSLSNQSLTQETREYVLRELTTSNPGGAIIKANGAPLSQGVLYSISGDPLNNSNEVTLTIERGPTRYSYTNLAVMMYPPCEWEIGGDLQRSDTLYLSVNFDTPCSDITLFRPEPGWTFNKADHDTGGVVLLILTDYELAISETDSVKSVWGQYRRLGTGLQGPEVWENIPADSLGIPGTIIQWSPPTALADGVYEFRAYTKCAGGRVYSNTSAGTIDRSAPQVLGAREPADEELSFGEKISITFNEKIDCRTIDAVGLLTYLDGPNAGDTIDVDIVCDGTKFVITPQASVDPDDLEGRLLQASVGTVRDLVGNPMDNAEVWTFTVRQSVFAWNDNGIAPEAAFRAPGSITAELVNGSDSVANFTISILPSWITGASPNSGSVAPGGTQSINFEIQEDIALGTYDSAVVAASNIGSATLDIFLTVSCFEPTWTFDPQRYENTMTIVAEVDILGAISADADDRVAAYAGNQLRGAANVDPATRLVYLTVAGNRTSGETMRFEVWDADACKLYNSTLERYPFVANDRLGLPDDPVSLTATDVLPDTLQAIPLDEGWNWFSTYVKTVDMSINGVLSDLTPAEGDVIKSDTSFAVFDPAMGWVGGLPLLDNVSSYMINLSEEGTILQEGSIVDPVSTPIPVGVGWNWIGYLNNGPLLLETAINGLATNKYLTDGDVLKSQTEFSQFYKDTWYGDLDSMHAGLGYQIYLATIPADASFNYPSLSGSPGPFVTGSPAPQPNPDGETAAAQPGWSFNRRAFQFNMTVIAAMNIEGEKSWSENDMIGAFVDGECRGVAQTTYLPATDQYVAFLMVHSDSVAGETVEFQAFVPEIRSVYNVAEAISYAADATVGTVREPLVINTKGIAFEVTETVPATYSLSQNYPNPFNARTVISYTLENAAHVSLEVFDVLGRKVTVLVDGLQPAGNHQIAWNGRNASGKTVASGIYFYRLTAGDMVKARKMLLLK